MKIYKNLWAGFPTYFVKVRQDNLYYHGCGIIMIDGKWKYRRRMSFYKREIDRDAEHFPLVGEVNLNDAIRRAIMNAVGVLDSVEYYEEDEKS